MRGRAIREGSVDRGRNRNGERGRRGERREPLGQVAAPRAGGSPVTGSMSRSAAAGWPSSTARYDLQLDRQVALKILDPALAGDGEFQQRFIRESRAAAAVDHPHIIPVFAPGEADGVLFIAMRYVAGGDVRTLLDTEGPLPARRAVDIAAQVASALDTAHARGLVHRDVKPANMLLDRGTGRRPPDHVYLSDFGLSKQALAACGADRHRPAGRHARLRRARSRSRTARWTAGRDQYSLACTTFEMLCGAPPFNRDQHLAVLWAQLSEPPPRLTARAPTCRRRGSVWPRRWPSRPATATRAAWTSLRRCGRVPASSDRQREASPEPAAEPHSDGQASPGRARTPARAARPGRGADASGVRAPVRRGPPRGRPPIRPSPPGSSRQSRRTCPLSRRHYPPAGAASTGPAPAARGPPDRAPPTSPEPPPGHEPAPGPPHRATSPPAPGPAAPAGPAVPGPHRIVPAGAAARHPGSRRLPGLVALPDGGRPGRAGHPGPGGHRAGHRPPAGRPAAAALAPPGCVTTSSTAPAAGAAFIPASSR